MITAPPQSLRFQPLSTGAGGVLTIDLGALATNYARLSQQAAPAVTAAVVKADAYGLGAQKVAETLYDHGCRHFFVALANEAFALRLQLRSDAHIYVLNGLQPGTELACAEVGLIPVLNSLDQIRRWAEAAKALNNTHCRILPCALQFDTGMSRLGLSPQELDALSADPAPLDCLDVRFIMSHLACADEATNPANPAQLSVMTRISQRFPNVPVSFANSGGIFLSSAYHHQIVRSGIALYGGAPHEGEANPMAAVVELKVAVIQTRTVPKGTQIGYGGTFTAPHDMRLATIAAGYADGLPRALSNRGAAWLGNVRLPICGRVSMDSLILDITTLPENTLNLGDFVELIGPHQSLEALAQDAGTIAYEILTSLGQRYQRYYLPVSEIPGPQSSERPA